GSAPRAIHFQGSYLDRQSRNRTTLPHAIALHCCRTSLPLPLAGNGPVESHSVRSAPRCGFFAVPVGLQLMIVAAASAIRTLAFSAATSRTRRSTGNPAVWRFGGLL